MRPVSVVLLSVLSVMVGCSTTRPSPDFATVQIASKSGDARGTDRDVYAAVLAETGAPTPDISTAELTETLSRGDAVVLDTRPRREWAVSHIPSALNVAPKPDVPMSQYVSDVAEIGRLVDGDKTRPLVLYCNGPFCGKSKRLSQELLSAGFTNVRRYQLGAPVWRALGGVMVTEPEGARYIFDNDRTAVWIDAREVGEYAAGSLGRARNIPRNKVLPGKDVGEIKAAKDDGRLPMEDHNTRIVVFGRDSEQARAVAEAIAREAFHNVSFFPGSYAELSAALAASSAASPPNTSTGADGFPVRHGGGTIVLPAGGTPLKFCDAPELSVNIKVDSLTARATRFAMGTATLAAGGSNSGTHRGEDEAIYFLRGAGRTFVGTDTVTVEAGLMLFVPQGVRHGFFNTGAAPLEFLWVVAPQGLASRFRQGGTSPRDSCRSRAAP